MSFFDYKEAVRKIFGHTFTVHMHFIDENSG